MKIQFPCTVVLATALAAASPSAQQCESSCPSESLASMPEVIETGDIIDVAVAAGKFKTLATALKAAGLVETLKGKGPFTVFAPTDAAFAALPKGAIAMLLKDKAKLAQVLTYHVLPGSIMASSVVKTSWAATVQGQSLRVQASEKGVWVDGAQVVKTDIKASNGVIHVIDAVMMPRKNIVETAMEAGSFKTLIAAVKAAGLVDALSGKGPFTVFAPTDAAFAKLPEGTVEGLLKDKAKLKAILTYHVVPGRILSTDIPAMKKGQKMSAAPKTLQGSSLTVKKTKRGGVQVDGASVVTADIIAGNGIIHVIDEVVLPR